MIQNRSEQEKQMLFLCYDARGQIMQQSIEMEKLIEYYIAGKFLEDENKKIEFIITIIAPHVIFSKKIEIFIHLVEKYDSWFNDKYNGITGRLTSLRDERNRFAHWPLDFSDIALTDFIERKGITLVRLKSVKAKDGEDPLSVDRHLYLVDGIKRVLAEMKIICKALQELTKMKDPSH